MHKLTGLISTKYLAWCAVLASTLAMSNWSLFWVARHLGVPPVIAILSSIAYDGAALVFADLSLRHARAGSPGSGARLAVFVCAGLSAYLNSEHAVIAHQIPAARIWYAAPPIIAVVAYEQQVKWERRRALANAGKIAPDLPTFGKWAIILFPIRTVRTARAIVKYRMGLLLARHTPGADRERSPFPVPGSSELSAGSGGFAGGFAELAGGFTELTGGIAEPTPGTIKHAREWAKARGYTVSTRGPLPADVMHEYIKALNTPAIVAGDEEITDEITDEIPDTGKETG